ncbi:NADP-dependent oxidoreductase [Saccharopolyspora sp. 5N708]|uniref:NADP-dependent oxidoreductase n=1 Tax=Saccharopolyspora sp. 5N708 TaxID=3457424 RepID=UPI003FCF9D75
MLELVEVERPRAPRGRLVAQVFAAAVNPGEIGIREGLFAQRWPANFPEGQGNDFAGRVVEVGDSVDGFPVGAEVIGFAPRAAHADFVVIEPNAVALKPPGVSWEQAACIAGVGSTAWASVEAVAPGTGETVVVSAAAGGVGTISAQLARLRGARVVGTAGPGNFEFLRSLGIEPVECGAGLRERLVTVAPHGIDAFLDNYGDGNVDLAVALGVAPERINTVADGAAVARYGVHADAQEQASSPEIWSRLAALVASGALTAHRRRLSPGAGPAGLSRRRHPAR